MAKKGTYAERAANPSRRWPKILIITLISLAVVAGVLFALLNFGGDLEHDNILENTTIAGVDVGGMTKAQAIAAVKAATQDTYTVNPMVVQIHQDTHTIDPSLSMADLDVEAAVEEAYAFGRTGFITQKKKEQQQAKESGYQVDLTKHLKLDTDAIRQWVESLSAQYNHPVIQPSYQLIGTPPSLAYDSTETGDQQLEATVGTPGYELNTAMLYALIIDSYNNNIFLVTADVDVVEPELLDLEMIHEKTYVVPIDAQMDPTTFKVVPHTFGYGFDLVQAQNMLADAGYGETFRVPFQLIVPAVTEESLNSLLFRDVLSEYTAYSTSIANRNTNLKLACQSVNGVVLMPGEIFSYNPTLGERTPEAGYKPADAYSGMETVSEYGGGICQVSSSIYYCAMVADLEIVERYNHGFVSAYMPYGMDATVSWGGPEFRFKNSSEYPIRIEAYASGGNVTIRIVGTDTRDYYVKMEYEILGVTNYKKVEKELPPDNPKGYKDGQTITSPYTGYKVNTYRCKYDKITNELISKDFEAYSNYSVRDHVVCKIVDPADSTTTPTEPSVPTEPSAPTDPSVPTTPTVPDTTEPPEETTTPTETTTPGITEDTGSDENSQRPSEDA